MTADNNVLTFLGYIRRKMEQIEDVTLALESGRPTKFTASPVPHLEIGWQRTVMLPEDQTRDRSRGRSDRIARLSLWVHIMVGQPDPQSTDPLHRALGVQAEVTNLVENGKFESSTDTVRVQRGLSTFEGATRISDPTEYGLPDEQGLIHIVVFFTVPVLLAALTQPASETRYPSGIADLALDVRGEPRFQR